MASFEVLEITGPNWPEVEGDRVEALLAGLQEGPWDEADGRQFAFREFRRVGGSLVGFFAVQSAVPYWTYADSGSPVFEEVEDAFQRVLTIVLPDEGRVILHNRRFFGTDLQVGLVRELFEQALTNSLTVAEIGPLRSIRPFSQLFSRDEIYRLFTEEQGQVAQVAIRDLHNATVPEEFIFFNPNFDLNQATRGLFNTGLRKIGKAEFEAAAHETIQDVKIVQSLAQAGTIAEFQVREAEYRRRRVSRRRTSRFDVDTEREELDAGTDAQIEEIRKAYEERYPARYPSPDSYWRGTIFEELGPSTDAPARDYEK